MDIYKNRSKKNTDVIVACAILAFIAAIVCCLTFFLTNGNTIISGGYPENQKNVSLRCIIHSLNYPFFRYDNSKSKDTEINAIFSEGAISSISINHNLYYDTIEDSDGSEAQNHASMGIYFAEDGLGADPFSAHYSKQQDRMSMTLYARASELDNISAKYFLIKDIDIKSSIDEYLEMYKAQGFNCSKSD